MDTELVNVYYNYLTNGSAFSTSTVSNIGAQWGVGIDLSSKGDYHPLLAFRYIKKKFGILEGFSLRRRLKRLQKAFDNATGNGQKALGDKIMKDLAVQTRESFMYAKGIKHFIEHDDIKKVKNKIRGGHISDTKFEDYTRIIPKDVLKKKKKTEGIFDGYVIYHYYNKELEAKVAKKQKMSEDEIAKMKDPILFGYIKENNRLYFIADWEDEFCDLTFDEIINYVAEGKIDKRPNL